MGVGAGVGEGDGVAVGRKPGSAEQAIDAAPNATRNTNSSTSLTLGAILGIMITGRGPVKRLRDCRFHADAVSTQSGLSFLVRFAQEAENYNIDLTIGQLCGIVQQVVNSVAKL